MVPKGWQDIHLGDVVTYKKGFAFNSSSYKSQGIRIVRISDTTRNSIHSENPVYLSKKDSVGLEQYILGENDIILSTVGSRPHLLDSMVGKAVKVPADVAGSLLNQNLVKLIPQEAKITNDYLYEMLKNNRFIFFISTLVRGNANQVSITLADLFDYYFILPPLSEQKKIAKILSTWDQAIRTTEQLLVNSQQQKKALMQQLLTGKKRLLDKNGVRFSGEWKKYKFGSLFSERVEIGRDDLPLLSITADDGVVYQEDTGRKNTSNEDKSKYRRICVNDIGYNTMRMWQGRSSLSNKEGIVSPAYTVVTPNSKVEPAFAAYIFKFPELVHVFYRYSQGLVSDTWNLKFSHFKKISWVIPSIEEQQKIASVLTTVDQGIETLQRKLDCLKQEKKALMQQLLTGKRRVKVGADEGMTQ